MLEDTSRYKRIDAATYAGIESAIICNLDEEKLNRFPYTFSHFSVHGEAFDWIRNFVETYKKFPTTVEIELTFPTIDTSTVGLTWDYIMDFFKKQVIWRSAEKCIKTTVEQLQIDPQKGVIDLISKLTDVTFDFDADITIYDDGSVRRLDEYEEDRRRYLENGGIVGIPTPFKTLQNLGSGWKPGELIGIFARSGIGKSWLCAEFAAIAALSGTRTLFISPEMTVKQLSLRLDTIIGHKLGYSFSHADLANLKPIDNKDEYVKFLQENNARTQAICHSTMGENGLTIQSIKNLIRRYHPQFVIIDGIYLIGSDTANASQHTWERSNDLTTAFKNIAVQQNVAVCVSTQANRENPDEYMPPAANTVAFGDGLLKAADYLFSMSKTLDSNGDYDERLRKVKCLKVRDGAILPGNIIFKWDVNSGDIEELENYELKSNY